MCNLISVQLSPAAFLTHISTVVVTVVTFGLYPIMEEERLAPAAVFAGLAFFNQLTVPLFIFPVIKNND